MEFNFHDNLFIKNTKIIIFFSNTAINNIFAMKNLQKF